MVATIQGARFEMVQNLDGVVIRIDLPTSRFQQVTNTTLGNGRHKIYTITDKVLAILAANHTTASGYYYLAKTNYEMLTQLAEQTDKQIKNFQL